MGKFGMALTYVLTIVVGVVVRLFHAALGRQAC